MLYEFADDVAPRHITAALPLDYDTVAAADKFCNVFLTRLPTEVSGQARWRPSPEAASKRRPPWRACNDCQCRAGLAGVRMRAPRLQPARQRWTAASAARMATPRPATVAASAV